MVHGKRMPPFFGCPYRGVLVPITKTILPGKVGTRDFDARNAIMPISSVPLTSVPIGSVPVTSIYYITTGLILRFLGAQTWVRVGCLCHVQLWAI